MPGCVDQYSGWCQGVERAGRAHGAVREEDEYGLGLQAAACEDAWGNPTVASPWRPQDLGTMLRLAAASGVYNELIVDSRYWDHHLPDAVEGIFTTADANGRRGEAEARRVHRAFVAKYGLREAEHPLLVLDRSNWEAPFRIA